MFNRSKKGVSAAFEALMGVIVMILVIVLIAFIFKSISDTASESAENLQCKASVTAYAKFNELPIGSEKADASTINCPTKYLTIESGTAKEMNRDIADLMVECWDNFGRGKLKLFTADDLRFCAICSVFEFEDKSTELKGLPLFMRTEKSPIKVGDRRVTYSEFLTGVLVGQESEKEKETEELAVLQGDKRYAVVFSYFSGTKREPFLLVFELSSAGAYWHTQTILAEYNEDMISNMGCDTLPVTQLDARFK
jgi:prepilin signal peptidase PulO-like enzyme (type II secretory pathway)